MLKRKKAQDTEYGTSHKSLSSYLIGFILCIVLTLIPFFLVAHHSLPVAGLYVMLTVFAIAQLYVQVVFFLRLNASPKGRWNLMSFFFAMMIVLILVLGSLWIMYNLNYNMMH
jgi:cytochrome o ubiquinol oxidase subunit IV